MKKTLLKSIQIIPSISLLLFFLFFLFLLYEGSVIRKDIELNGKDSVGKYISYHRYKTQFNYFTFNIKGIRYKGEGGGPSIGSLKNVGKFYRIRYSEKFKGSLQAFLNEEITDTTEILKAGFTTNDILRNDSVYAKESSFKDDFLTLYSIKRGDLHK